MAKKLSHSFGRILHTARKEQRLTQAQLAENCQLDRTFISMMERGERQPTLSTLFILARELDLAPSELVVRLEGRLRRQRWMRQGPFSND